MTMYKSLMKVFFKENLSLKRLLGTDPKKQKAKTILIIFLIVYLLAVFIFGFGYMFYTLAEGLHAFGLIEVLLIYAFIYSTALTMIFVVFRANGYLFNYKDYEILEPLPIKPRTVLAAKLTVMLTFIYASTFIFLIPMMFSYYTFAGFDLVSLIFFLIAFITLPLIPTIVFSFFSLLIARISSNFRRSNLINIILLFVLFLGIMVLQFSLTSIVDENPLLNQQAFMSNLGRYYSPIKWFMQAVYEKKILSLLLLLVVNGALFTGFVFLVESLVKKTNQKGLTRKTRKNNKAAISKQRSVVLSISAKELKNMINTPIYALNSGFGAVIMFVLGVASLFFKDSIAGFMGELTGLGIPIESMVLLIFGFSMSMTCTTAVSLSLEGKHFWLMKSLPIPPKTVMHGKMLFNIILGLPAALLGIIFLSYSLELEILNTLIMMLFMVSLSLVITVFGSVINLYFPKFKWRSPTEVVKQSAGVLIGLFGGWAILFINGLIYYLLIDSISFVGCILLAGTFNLLLALGLFILVNKKSESLFNKFEV